jgi:transposase
VAQQTRLKNRLRSLLQRHHLLPPGGELFATANRSWWLALKLNPSEKLRARQDLVLLDHLAPLITEVESEINRLSLAEPWAQQTPYLLQLPGIGLITAMTILGAIGEIERFPTAKKLVGYAGLGARIHSSGQTHRTGGTQAPNKAVRNSGQSWSKRLGQQCGMTRTGRNNSSGWLTASAGKKPSWPLPASCWSSSGTS